MLSAEEFHVFDNIMNMNENRIQVGTSVNECVFILNLSFEF